LATEAISQILQYKWKQTAVIAYIIMFIYTGYLATLIWWENYYALVGFAVYFVAQEIMQLANVAYVAYGNDDSALIWKNYVLSFGLALSTIRIILLLIYLGYDSEGRAHVAILGCLTCVSCFSYVQILRVAAWFRIYVQLFTQSFLSIWAQLPFLLLVIISFGRAYMVADNLGYGKVLEYSSGFRAWQEANPGVAPSVYIAGRPSEIYEVDEREMGRPGMFGWI
jgi:hypothetical protein